MSTTTVATTTQTQQGANLRDHLSHAVVSVSHAVASVNQGAIVAHRQIATSEQLPRTLAQSAMSSFALCGIATRVLGSGLVTKITGAAGTALSVAFFGLKFIQLSHKNREQEETIAQLQTVNTHLQARLLGAVVEEPGEEPVRAGVSNLSTAAASSAQAQNENQEIRSPTRTASIAGRSEDTESTNTQAASTIKSNPKPAAKLTWRR